MELKDTYNRIAEDWHKDHQNDDWWVDGTNDFISLFSNAAEILDVGCGSGTKAQYLSSHGLKVTGIDFSDKLLEIAKREVPSAQFMVMDMHDATSLNQKFDGVFAQASLLHIPKAEVAEILSGLVSVLKDNGYLYVAVKGVREGKPEEEVKEENDYGYSYERFFSYFSMNELENHFKSLKLDVIYRNISAVGKTDWLQIIGKKS